MMENHMEKRMENDMGFLILGSVWGGSLMLGNCHMDKGPGVGFRD